jgi:hypothetical protein
MELVRSILNKPQQILGAADDGRGPSRGPAQWRTASGSAAVRSDLPTRHRRVQPVASMVTIAGVQVG